MSDLLGSILDNMTAPPSTEDKASHKRRRAMKRKLEEETKQRSVRVKEIEGEVEKFALGQEKEFSFKSTEKEWRAIQHEMCEIGGLVSISCYNGPTEEKHVTVFKKEACPSEVELKKRRLGERYIDGFVKAGVSSSGDCYTPSSSRHVVPNRNYQDKYKRMLDRSSSGVADTREYHGLVPVHMLCEPKTIEESMTEIRQKKRLKGEQQKGEIVREDTEESTQHKPEARTIKFT